MSRSVRDYLDTRCVQPIVELNFLNNDFHIDEIMCFMPDPEHPNDESKFKIWMYNPIIDKTFLSKSLKQLEVQITRMITEIHEQKPDNIPIILGKIKYEDIKKIIPNDFDGTLKNIGELNKLDIPPPGWGREPLTIVKRNIKNIQTKINEYITLKKTIETIELTITTQFDDNYIPRKFVKIPWQIQPCLKVYLHID